MLDETNNSPQPPLRWISGVEAERTPAELTELWFGPESEAAGWTEQGPSTRWKQKVQYSSEVQWTSRTDSLIDWCILTFSSSSSRVWSWSTTVKTVRVSSALSGRQRPGLHFWISATVLLMDWIFCSTVCRHKKDIQKNWSFKTNHHLAFIDFGLFLSWRSHHVDIRWYHFILPSHLEAFFSGAG